MFNATSNLLFSRARRRCSTGSADLGRPVFNRLEHALASSVAADSASLQKLSLHLCCVAISLPDLRCRHPGFVTDPAILACQPVNIREFASVAVGSLCHVQQHDGATEPCHPNETMECHR